MAHFTFSRTVATRDMLRELIDNSGSKLFSVKARKVNGDTMHRVYQAAATATHCVGTTPGTPAAARVESRKANNPNLFNVYDVTAGGIRCFNFDKVDQVTIMGNVFTFTDQ